MNLQSATTQVKFYVQKFHEKLSELYWKISQKVWKGFKKGISIFDRGNVSDG